MNSILAQAGFPPGTFNLVLYGLGAVVLLVLGEARAGCPAGDSRPPTDR